MNNVTKRNTVASLEKILFEELPVLDHGFVRVIDYMGDDSAVVQSARVSYGKGTKHGSRDQDLINYLMRNRHTTPFEMCEIKLHVKLPIFVARQWVRHRTANINEYSARYSILDKEFYVPDLDNIAEQSKVNNQGRSDKPLPDEVARKVHNLLKNEAVNCYKNYEYCLEKDLARELSRMVLSANFYTQWYWKIDLHNLLHFVKLRNDKHAQYEIGQYAAQILKIVEKWVPMTYKAFTNYNMYAVTVSQNAISLIKDVLKNRKQTDYKKYSIGNREWKEMNKIFEMGDL
ncbi:MAG: FAD-dependent thymidylate synthase [Rickettsiaceae bacterium H1]|nr:FAD-dependent thymidylate synthase [Rickettsiaceae bacterium H1]